MHLIIFCFILEICRNDSLKCLSGEWWDANPIDVVRQATRTGGAPNVSDAYTINGQPGDLYKCSSQGWL